MSTKSTASNTSLSPEELIWIFPTSITKAPTLAGFETARENLPFKGRGRVLSCLDRPNFSARGKRGVMLFNITLRVQDLTGDGVLSLKFFNCYPSQKSNLEKLKLVEFEGIVTSFTGMLQITNPEIKDLEVTGLTVQSETDELTIKYPTYNGITPKKIKSLVKRMPHKYWDAIDDQMPDAIVRKRDFMTLKDAIMIMHGMNNWTEERYEEAKNRIIYYEFFNEQVKIIIRRIKNVTPDAPILEVNDSVFNNIKSIFSFDLTADQQTVLQDIREDLASGHPMMRLIQGDVGCGKTAIAIASAMIAIKNRGQVALMCPTETLALQHFLEISSLLKKFNVNVQLLLGSTKSSDKMQIAADLISGQIDFVIGTHALITETVEFNNLTLAIIDEQHKFGVKQRIALTEKGTGTHSLIMTATPIPRSLSMTQFGDLDISTIKTMPSGRKGQKTRIVMPETFEQFLCFLQSRMEMNEQIYIVTPAIEESESLDLMALNEVFEKFKKYFPNASIKAIHGKMKPAEKEAGILSFMKGETKILIATSVIEVGINNPNATVMAIMNPERFGLSSLHQLRGRVGRGDKMGFCFLVCSSRPQGTAYERLRVIENTTDGFKIAECDLRLRGEGDLFGTDQSGSKTTYHLADMLTHSSILSMAREDARMLYDLKDPYIMKKLDDFSADALVLTTI